MARSQSFLPLVMIFICIIAVIATAVSADDLIIQATLVGNTARRDEAGKSSTLELTFVNYDAITHPTLFDLSPSPNGIAFVPQTGCQEENVDSTIIVQEGKMKIQFTFEQKNPPDLLSCTFKIENPVAPTSTASIRVDPIGSAIELPPFYTYFKSSFSSNPAPELGRESAYTFSLDAALDGSENIHIKWNPDFRANMKPSGACQVGANTIPFIFNAPNSELTLTFPEGGYKYQEKDTVACLVTSPLEAPATRSHAKIKNGSKTVSSDPIVLPFGPAPAGPTIKEVKVTPNQTTLGLETTLSVQVNLSETYIPDQHDVLNFSTWIRFPKDSKCTYISATEVQFTTPILEREGGFKVQIQDDWTSVFEDNKILLTCGPFVPTTPQPETGATISIATADGYESPTVGFIVPAFVAENQDPEIEALTLTPEQTKIKIANSLTIFFEISDFYIPDKNDFMEFTTWVRFPTPEQGAKCFYGVDGGEEFSLVPINTATGFRIPVQDNWSALYYENQITIKCPFVAPQPQPASEGTAVLVKTKQGDDEKDEYRSPPFKFTLPAFVDDDPIPPTDWAVTYTTDNTVPSDKSKSVWKIMAGETISANKSNLRFNITSFLSTVNPKDCQTPGVSFKYVEQGMGDFEFAAGTFVQGKQFEFSCVGNNGPNQVLAGKADYVLSKTAQVLSKGSFPLPAYTWPSKDVLGLEMTLSQAETKFFATEKYQKFIDSIAQVYKLNRDVVWALDITESQKVTEHNEGKLQENLTLTVIVAFNPGYITRTELDANLAKVRTAVAKATGYKVKINLAAKFPYPEHCFDGIWNPVSEADVDCGIEWATKGGQGCKPCAVKQKCYGNSMCTSHNCVRGKCEPGNAFGASVALVLLAVASVLLF